MSSEPFFGNWLVAIAEAAEVAGVTDIETATVSDLTRAWGLVRKAADIPLDELVRGIAEQAELGVADLDGADPRAAVLIPAEVAHRRNVLPLRCDETDVTVATSNPLSQDARREVAALTGRTVTFEVAAPSELGARVETVYGELDPAEAAAPPAVVETEQPHGPHVLVVDDEAGQRALFRSVLEEGDFRVTLASDGAEALEVLRSDADIDLVSLDYWMDKMNGLRVLQMIRSDHAIETMPVIMVTGAGDRQIEMSLFEAGADDYIAKPIDAPLYLLRVQAVLRRRRFG